MPDPGTCRGCGQQIGWVRMASGKAMPVDLDKQVIVREGPGGGEVVEGYRAHWATCPKAGDFRRKAEVAR